MLRFPILFLSLCAAIMSYAQETATVIYKNNGSKVAVKVSDIDRIEVKDNVAEIVHDTIYVVDTVYVKSSPESKWKGRRIGFLGDSITEFGEYVNSFAQLTECNAMNYGISATHMARRNSGDANAFDARYNRMPYSLDMVIVFGGTNDFGHADTADFGEFTDGANPNKYTFYAGLHRLFKGLSLRYRNKPVVVMTPLHHGVRIDTPEYSIGSDGSLVVGKNPKTGKTFEDYVNAIKEVAAYYSLIVIDAYSFSGLSPLNETQSSYFFRDGLHLNERGGERLAKWMYPQLEMIYDMYYK
jgi:lysophospholipase L1-like esterase